MFEKQARSLKRRYHLLFPRKQVRRDGLDYDLDCRELIDYGIFRGGWEADTLDFLRDHVKDGFVTLEVGANVGAHTLIIAKLSGENGVLHAIEPTVFAHTKFLRNLSLNPEIEKRVHVHDLLISDTVTDHAQVQIRSSWPECAKRIGNQWKPCRLRSPRSTSWRQSWDSIALIFSRSISTATTSGAARTSVTIEEFRPLILVEFPECSLKKNGDSVTGIIQYLTMLDMTATTRMKNLSVSENVLARIGNNEGINGIFYPGEKREQTA